MTLSKTVEEVMQVMEVKHHYEVPLEAGNTREEYVVEHIICLKKDHAVIEYLVQWFAYILDVNT